MNTVTALTAALRGRRLRSASARPRRSAGSRSKPSDLQTEHDRAVAARAGRERRAGRARTRALDATRIARAARESELASARIEHEWRARDVRSREHELASLTARLRSLEELDAHRAGFSDAARMVLVAGQRPRRTDGRARRRSSRSSRATSARSRRVSASCCSTCWCGGTNTPRPGSRWSARRTPDAAASSSSMTARTAEAQVRPVRAALSGCRRSARPCAGRGRGAAVERRSRSPASTSDAIRDGDRRRGHRRLVRRGAASWRAACRCRSRRSTATCCAARIWSPAAARSSRAASSRPSARSRSCASASPPSARRSNGSPTRPRSSSRRSRRRPRPSRRCPPSCIARRSRSSRVEGAAAARVRRRGAAGAAQRPRRDRDGARRATRLPTLDARQAEARESIARLDDDSARRRDAAGRRAARACSTRARRAETAGAARRRGARHARRTGRAQRRRRRRRAPARGRGARARTPRRDLRDRPHADARSARTPARRPWPRAQRLMDDDVQVLEELRDDMREADDEALALKTSTEQQEEVIRDARRALDAVRALAAELDVTRATAEADLDAPRPAVPRCRRRAARRRARRSRADGSGRRHRARRRRDSRRRSAGSG